MLVLLFHSQIALSLIRSQAGTHGDTMVMNLNELCPDTNIPMYVFDEIVTFWYELRIKMSHDKRKVIKMAFTSPQEAPPHNDHTGTVSGLMTIIHLYDASHKLDDETLQLLTLAHLRERLINLRYSMDKWIEAMDVVCSREREEEGQGEKNILLRRIFLASAIYFHERLDGKDADRVSFLQQMFWHSDFMEEFWLALRWYHQRRIADERLMG